VRPASHRCRRELRPKPKPPESKGTPDLEGGIKAGASAGLKTKSPSGNQRGQGDGPLPYFCVPRTRFPELPLCKIREIIDPMDQAKLHNSFNRPTKAIENDLLKRRTIILVFQWNQSCYNSPTTRGSAVGLFAVPPGRIAVEAPGTRQVPDSACTYVSSGLIRTYQTP
jgi:hypothetical protein